jgi:hypothetical protein
MAAARLPLASGRPPPLTEAGMAMALSAAPPSARWTRVVIAALLVVTLGSLGFSAYLLSDQARLLGWAPTLPSPAELAPPAMLPPPVVEAAAPAPPILEPATAARSHHHRHHAVATSRSSRTHASAAHHHPARPSAHHGRPGSAHHPPPRLPPRDAGQASRHYPWV